MFRKLLVLLAALFSSAPALALSPQLVPVILGQAPPALSFNFGAEAGSGVCQTPLVCSRSSNATDINSSGVLAFAPNNGIRNNTMVGAAVGSPGTLPTDWSTQGTLDGVSMSVVNLGTEFGMSFIDIAVSGTATASTTWNMIGFDTAGQSSVAGYDFVGSVYYRVVSGTLPSSASQLAVNENENNWESGCHSASATLVNTSTLTRVSAGVLTTGCGDQTTIEVSLAITLNTTYNYTIRFYAPQIERTFSASGAPSGPWITSGSAYFGPRFDYTWGTATPFLVEAYAATNLIEESNSVSSWTLTNATAPASAATSPDGTADAWALTDNSTSGNHIAKQSATITAAATVTVSCFFQKGTNRYIQIEGLNSAGTAGFWGVFDTQAGTFSQVNQATGTGAVFSSSGQLSLANGWYRAFITGTVDSSSTSVFALIGMTTGPTNSALSGFSYSGTGSTINGYGCDLKQQSVLDSYVPTTTATVTRAADVDTIAVSSLPPLSALTITAEFAVGPATTPNGRVIGAIGGNAWAPIFINGSEKVASYDGANSALTTNAISLNGALTIASVSQGPQGQFAVSNGGPLAGPAPYNASGAPTNTVQLGQGANIAVGPIWFKSLKWYGTQLPSGKLPSLQ